MKYVITGSAGNVSKPLAEMLLQGGHDVTVVGRNPDNLKALVAKGAKAAIGDLHDVAFLTDAFKGADGVYLMLPPMWNSDDQKKESIVFAEGFKTAIQATGVTNAVFLSSYGAHRLDDAGAISGMGLAEKVLNTLDGVNILHLRAGYFYTNLLLSIDLIKTAGHMGNMFEIPDGTFTVVDPEDIARAAAQALTAGIKGHSFRYIVSDESGTDEIATLIGKEIGIPDLKWLRVPKEDFRNVLLSYGFAKGAANDYVEMFETLDSGRLFEHYVSSKATYSGTSIETFAKKFAAVYKQ
ncbi:NmrA family NAD(P)-binding protein [Duganella aceris]|uniref:NAD(P)H-binding protein n=1 Tax=Duganella aceris TaxID=2703883 RepID=A0ABX0FKQ8_9BURK|nr:NAD(P)H-binding protein [Duganella aceris]NGZ85097.1 NAD(P)H-binding protein [Duganella aceris]